MECPTCGQTRDDAGAECPGCARQHVVPPTPPTVELSPGDPPRLHYGGTLAIILGLAGLATTGLSAFLGLIIGIWSVADIRRNPREYYGLNSALIGVIVSAVLFVICLPSMCLPHIYGFHGRRKVRESDLKGNLQQMRMAIAQFHTDTGRYPLVLDDLVAPTSATVRTAVKVGSYKGPYLNPKGGIDGKGLPLDPFATATDINVSHHWKYTPATGTVTVPDRLAKRETMDDAIPYGKL